MPIETQIEELERDIRRLQETADENNSMLKAICETLGIEKSHAYGDYSGPEVPLRARIDSIVDRGQQ
jgi:hypothetical protein